jgi:hypothetical protein
MRVLRYLAKIAPQVAISLHIDYDCRKMPDFTERFQVSCSLNAIVNGRRMGVSILTGDPHDEDNRLWCTIPAAGFDQRFFREEYRELILRAAAQLREQMRQRQCSNWLIERQLQRLTNVLKDTQHLERLNQE